VGKTAKDYEDEPFRPFNDPCTARCSQTFSPCPDIADDKRSNQSKDCYSQCQMVFLIDKVPAKTEEYKPVTHPVQAGVQKGPEFCLAFVDPGNNTVQKVKSPPKRITRPPRKRFTGIIKAEDEIIIIPRIVTVLGFRDRAPAMGARGLSSTWLNFSLSMFIFPCPL